MENLKTPTWFSPSSIYISLLVLFSFIVVQQANAQKVSLDTVISDNGFEPCGHTKKTEQLYKQHPELRPENNPAAIELAKFTEKFIKTNGSSLKNTENIIIPVVVHVMHENGPENLSDQVVIEAIEDLNTCFDGSNPNIGGIHSDFVSLKSDVPISFELAKFDPDGNPTNGIEHILSSYTNAGDDPQLKIDTRWPRDEYLNVWICKNPVESSNASGLAFYPAEVDGTTWEHLDGISIAYWAIGNHANTQTGFEYILAHEVGHWANLRHAWGSGSAGRRKNCNNDDEVADTPNTQGNPSYDANFCGSIKNSCSSNDNISNFMDYAVACYAMFTEGQNARMIATLNSSVSGRNNLWSDSNLQATLGYAPDTTGGGTNPIVSCSDGIQNGDELGIDCGGSCSATCDTGGSGDCDAPTNLTSTPSMNGKRATLEWDVVAGADYYNLRYREIGRTWRNFVPETNSLICTGLKKDKSYEWEINSVCGNDISEVVYATFIAGYPSSRESSRLISNSNFEDVTLYPNPATENVFVSGLVPSLAGRRIAIFVYNINGNRIVYESAYVNNNGKFDALIDINELVRGQYFVAIRTNDYSKIIKLNKF